MPTPRALATAHAPLLVLDAAASRVQVGVVERDGSARWAGSEQEAGIALFALLRHLEVKPAAIGAFVFCAGPGSILGIRTAAMAIRTWCALHPRPCWSYFSLELLVAAQPPPRPTAIADARRDSWHYFTAGSPLRRVPTQDLPAGPDYCAPEGFRAWTHLPAAVQPRLLPYLLPDLWAAAADVDLLHPVDEPDAFLHEDPAYVTWTPQIHRAPPPA